MADSLGDQLAHAQAGRVARVPLRFGDAGQAAGLRHFQHGGGAIAKQAPFGCHRRKQGAGHFRAHAPAAHGTQKRVYRPLAAIGNGDGHKRRAGEVAGGDALQYVADFHGRQRAFHGI